MTQPKTTKDIALLREAGTLHAGILREMQALLLLGKSTADIDTEAARLIKEAGGAPAFLGYKPSGASRPYPASVCVSVNEEIVHGIPTEEPRTIKDGDLVSIDIGFLYKGVITDAAVTVCVGQCSKENRDLNNATREALYEGIQAMEVGGSVGDIGAAIAGYVRSSTSFRLVQHLCGHGVGFSVHEDPFVPNTGRKGEGPRLTPGLVIAIEPMLTTGSGEIALTDDGFTYRTKENTPASHWEHTVAVTEDGIEILTE